MTTEDLQNFELQKCDICNRSFQLSSLEKHQNVCRKLQSKKRPVFDSSKQRSIPVPDDYVGPKNPAKDNRSAWAINGSPSTRWSRLPPKGNATTRPVRVPSKTHSLDDQVLAGRRLHSNRKAMVECPHCRRTFQEGSADRHISFCQEIHNRIPLLKDDWDAKWKLAMRTQYQPPRPRARGHSINSKASSCTPPRRTKRVAPLVVEEGLMTYVPDSDSVQRHQLRPLYNRRIEPEYCHLSPSPRKPRSRMVTYGAVQPFSGPVLSKEEKRNRFQDKQEAKKPQRVYVTDNVVFDGESGSPGQIIMYPDTISAQIQTDQYEVPKLEPVIMERRPPSQSQPIMMHRYPPAHGYWPGKWPSHPQPWYSEDYYMQMAPRMMAPVYYQPQWSPYQILPDVVPRTPQSFSHPMKAIEYRPGRDGPQTPRYRPVAPNDRNYLSRDDTILDDDSMYFGGSSARGNHRFCANCGTKFHDLGTRYCSDCGAINEFRK